MNRQPYSQCICTAVRVYLDYALESTRTDKCFFKVSFWPDFVIQTSVTKNAKCIRQQMKALLNKRVYSKIRRLIHAYAMYLGCRLSCTVPPHHSNMSPISMHIRTVQVRMCSMSSFVIVVQAKMDATLVICTKDEQYRVFHCL